MNIREELTRLLKEKILVIDGAMGTMIQQYKLGEEEYRGKEFENHESPLKGNNDLLSITQPHIIKEIHLKYLEAGADILETNSFSATSISQSDYNLEEEAYQINVRAAQIACDAINDYKKKYPEAKKYVAGAIGPTNRTASISPDVNNPGFRAVTFDTLKEAYYEQAKGLMDGGVDLFLVETVFDTLNAKAALFAISELLEKTNKDVPIMVSGTITDASGRTLSGQTTEAFLISVSHIPLLSIGLNCALGAEEMRPYLKILSERANCNISAYPNAGLPNEFGEYDQSPEEMAQFLKEFAEAGMLNMVGGCCGTTPDHISAIAKAVKNCRPHQFKNQTEYA